ncbi:hypothetical protein [Nonomuraea sp. PA05]|uniref:hypothetical protein n=1 Tax=Nonomuraea sp. PA05 TaxID=2604466 RepID=UPI001651E67F|nr:hypothetical protein [Nonomuraea sp. PA05]
MEVGAAEVPEVHPCRGPLISTAGNRAELELWDEDDIGRRTTLGRAEVIYDEETP